MARYGKDQARQGIWGRGPRAREHECPPALQVGESLGSVRAEFGKRVARGIAADRAAARALLTANQTGERLGSLDILVGILLHLRAILASGVWRLASGAEPRWHQQRSRFGEASGGCAGSLGCSLASPPARHPPQPSSPPSPLHRPSWPASSSALIRQQKSTTNAASIRHIFQHCWRFADGAALGHRLW
ncbi:hypothetical protein ANO11243_030410 [Dothideomycetidae sp. 11243]|nr:hypothetical protein ANO11243_030410 [fungal sp. No.11243]